MAADSSQILREYLIALGFQVNETEAKKFDTKLVNWDKKVNVLGKSIIGVGAAVTAMVGVFAYQMDKLYFASKRTDSAAGSIQALEYAGKKIGVGGDAMRNALEGMARALRSNPGLYGLLNSLGVPVKGRDKADVLTDLVTQLNKMPTYIAERYAALFGIDPDTLYMIRLAGDEFKKAQEARKQLAADMGVDADAAAKAGHEMAQAWNDATEAFGIFRDGLILLNIDKVKELGSVVKELEKDWLRLMQESAAGNNNGIFQRLMEGLGLAEVGGDGRGEVSLTRGQRGRLGQGEADQDYVTETDIKTGKQVTRKKKWTDRLYDKFMQWGGAKKYQGPSGEEAAVDTTQDLSGFSPAFGNGASDAEMTAELRRRGIGYSLKSGGAGGVTAANGVDRFMNRKGTAALFDRLEKQYGLPAGTLDRIWAAESNRGDPNYMLSSKGAKGHFGLMPGTAKELGVNDPNDLESSADGAARYYGQQLKRFGGNNQLAAAAYNWGPENVSKYGLGKAPAETQGYIDKVAPVSIHQENHVNVSGVSDPQKAADAVDDAQRQNNADLTRNLRTKVY